MKTKNGFAATRPEKREWTGAAERTQKGLELRGRAREKKKNLEGGGAEVTQLG